MRRLSIQFGIEHLTIYVANRKLRWCIVPCHRNIFSLQWRHNGRDSVSNHQPHDCLLKRLFRRRSKKTSKPRVTGLCEGNSPVTCDFPEQRASNAEHVSIWWRHHVCNSISNDMFYFSAVPSNYYTLTVYFLPNTSWFRYNVVNFHRNPHNKFTP